MAINKKNFLATKPTELGQKDAIHVAIVSVRAGKSMAPGQHFTMKDGEAVPANPKDSVGVVSPFLRSNVMRGDSFWGLLKMDEIESVKHVWDHPQFSFEAPKTEPSRNKYIESYSKEFGVTYEELMEACSKYVNDEQQSEYPGTLSEEAFDKVVDYLDSYDLYSEWGNEALYEFSNMGTECCPEYDYPSGAPFYFVPKV